MHFRCLGVVDTSEHFHLLDVRSRERLETLDLTGVQLVYQTQFFKGAATGKARLDILVGYNPNFLYRW